MVDYELTVGGGGDKTDFSQWLTDTQGDLSGRREIALLLDNAMTGGTISGSSNMSATDYRMVTFDDSIGPGAADGTGAGFQSTDFTVLGLAEAYSRAERIVIEKTSTNGSGYVTTGTGDYSGFDGCVFIANCGGSGSCTLFEADLFDTGVYVRNCIGRSEGTRDCAGIYAGYDTEVSNCVVYNMIGSTGTRGYGIGEQIGGGTTVFRNCISSENETGDFDPDTSSHFDYCLSSDTTAPGTNSVTSEAGTTTFTDAANNDFTLKSGSGAIGAGEDLSSDFTTDFNGDTWPATWDMGAILYVSAVTRTPYTAPRWPRRTNFRLRDRRRDVPGIAPLLPTSGTTEVTVTPGTLTLTATDPAIGLARDIEITPASLSLTATTPSVDLTVEVTVSPGSLTLTPTAATIGLAHNVDVTPGVLTLTATAATIGGTHEVDVTPASLTLTATAATIDLTKEITVTPGTLTLTATAATIDLTKEITVTPGVLTLTATNPVVGSVHEVTVTPGVLTLTATSAAIGLAKDVTVTPGVLTLTATPAAIGGSTTTVNVTPGVLTLTPTAATIDTFSICTAEHYTSIEIPAAQAFYLGDPDTAGSWRIIRIGDDLLMQRLESGTWTTKSTILA